MIKISFKMLYQRPPLTQNNYKKIKSSMEDDFIFYGEIFDVQP